MRNIILTGIPRSGTTLVASLLDREPNSVCLGEPEWHRPHPSLDAKTFAKAIEEDFKDLRHKLLAGIPVKDRRGKNGEVVTNYYSSEKNFELVDFTRKGLTPDFTLAVKHNAPYLAVLHELIALGTFEIRAVIRHPLEVLRSWRRLDLPISRGELPNAVSYWPQMQEAVKISDLLLRQVAMLDAMFARIRECENKLTLIRYEELAGEHQSQQSSRITQEDESILAALKKNAPQARHFYSL